MSARPRLRLAGRCSAGGLLAGAAVGLLDIVLRAGLGGNPDYLHGALWAIVAYGLVGLLAGLALGLLFSVVRAGWDAQSAYAFTWSLVFCSLAWFVTRYRLYRDLFHESIRTFSLQGLLFNGGLLLAFAALFFLLFWLWRRPILRPISRAWPSVACFLLVAVTAAVIGFVVHPGEELALAPAGIPPGLEDAPNIILIGVDTLRADRLSSYGYVGSRTPNIDALAGDGVRYAEMTAQASWTKPSFASIFTSLYPSSHTATGKPHSLPQAVTTLAEALAARGYHTGGLADNPSISAAFGFDQGFADYVYLEPAYLFRGNEAASQTALYQVLRRVWAKFTGGRVYSQYFYQDAAVVNQHALEWLAANKGTRFFLFLHYMDPHDPYFEHPYNGVGYARANDQNPDPAMASLFSDLYDGEVRYLDEQLGRLWAWLQAEGLYDGSLIILTADHGEEFQEHGGWWHGQTLYQEQIAVPLIIKYPHGLMHPDGTAGAAVVDELARSVDIAPTILDAVGQPVPDSMVGRSLWTPSEAPAFAFAEEDHEGNVLQSLRSDTLKLILANADNPRGLPSESLFDLVADPSEQQDLLPADMAQAAALKDALRLQLTAALERAVAGETGTLDVGLQEKLRDLGY
ncbi:sulfatase [Chloroflexota bacterium]